MLEREKLLIDLSILPVLDFAYLSMITEGDMALTSELSGLFAQQIEECRHIFSSRDEKAQWERTLHTLKGTALSLGAARVAHCALFLENTIKEDTQTETVSLFSLLFLEAEGCLEALRAMEGDARERKFSV